MKPSHALRPGLSLLIATLLLTGCGLTQQLPSTGPSQKDMQEASARASGIQFVDVDASVAHQLARSQRKAAALSEAFGTATPTPSVPIGAGDVLDVSIWEAPPATLFGGGALDPRGGVSTSRMATFPEQIVDRDGHISVPFAGRIKVSGLATSAVETEIARRLKGKANQPEVLVRLVRNNSATVTVVGEVANSVRLPLSVAGERLLDAIAAAGGVRQPVQKMTVQVTRGAESRAMPLDQVIRDPAQNIRLMPGDVITASFQPLSFTALGATGKNEEITFETQGISLAQALARAGGLMDTRSSPEGVFVFRFEPAEALDWPNKPVAMSSEGKVPVVYRLNMRDPRSLFVAQSFMMNNKDLLYVSNAPAADLQKLLNLVFSVAYPVLNTIQVVR